MVYSSTYLQIISTTGHHNLKGPERDGSIRDGVRGHDSGLSRATNFGPLKLVIAPPPPQQGQHFMGTGGTNSLPFPYPVERGHSLHKTSLKGVHACL